MREFESREIFRAKCIVCGCKNKVHTELLDRSGKFVGYNLKCCACGNSNDFMLNYEDNGVYSPSPFGPYRKGRQTCIQPSFCPRKDCKLYGTCKKNKKPKPDKQPSKDNILNVEVVHRPNFL